MMKKWVIFLLLLTISQGLSIEFKGYVSDTKSIINPKGLNIHKAFFIVGMTTYIYTQDSHIQDWVQKNRNNTTNRIAKFAKPFGDGKYTLPPLAFLYLYGGIKKNKGLKRISLLGLESFLISGMLTNTIKIFTQRDRPNRGNSYNSWWEDPRLSFSSLSFPSGHACAAFSIAGVIGKEYNGTFISPLAYSIATLTALSRVNDNCHWGSDVFLGSCIGLFTSHAIVTLHKRDINITLLPTALSFKYNF